MSDSDIKNVDADENLDGDEVMGATDENSAEVLPDSAEPQTFSAEYVGTLRSEAAEHRQKARDAQEISAARAAELWHLKVAALGVLADPADLPLDIDALDDDARIAELADELLTAKPHLRSRAIRERMGQGEGTASEGDGDLLSRMLGGRL